MAFTYAPGRSGQYAEDILNDFSGILQVDGYAGYNRLLKRPAQDVQLAYCWAHARRELHEVSLSGTTPIADEGLKQITALYRIEKDIRGQSPKARWEVRQERSKPIIATFEAWLIASRARVSAKSPLGEALKYIAKYWTASASSWKTVAWNWTTVPSSAPSANRAQQKERPLCRSRYRSTKLCDSRRSLKLASSMLSIPMLG